MLKLVEIFGSISSVLIIKLFVDQFFYRKEEQSSLKLVIFISVFMLFLVASNLFPIAVVTKAGIIILGTIVLCYTFYYSTVLQAIFVSVAFETIAAVTEIITMGIMTLLGINTHFLMTDNKVRTIFILATQIIVLLFVILSGVFSEKKNENLKLKWFLPLIPCQILSVAICYLLFIYNNFDVFNIILLIVLLYINIAFVFYVEMVRKGEEKQRCFELAEQQYEMQKEYYQRLHENQEETRALWHDIQKYVTAMQAVVSAQDNKMAQTIIQQAKQTLNDINIAVDVENIVVSSILNSYLQEAKVLEIDMKMDVYIPRVLPVSPVDLSILLGNTLDNAIEACSSLPDDQRWIKIKLSVHNQTLFYKISNPYQEQRKIHFRGKYHGYGLSNVKRCVARYDGDVQVLENEGVFEVNARINCSV